ncbi:germin-like protein [Neltuma alba]|uniref:germin-like protein n=1 Tax=Neltuma alba TaxID=207710 RepID=UPI0010A4FADC|nr:germin-like protein [Prosopis alba]
MTAMVMEEHGEDYRNYTAPYGPSGYSCKNPANVTIDDFVFSGLNVRSNNTNAIVKVGFRFVFVSQLAGLNGQGLSLARIDYEVGGVLPIHTHPGASETLLVLEGNLTVGFISTNNTVYLKTLNPGDVILFPQGLLHFHINEGNTSAVAIANYNSPNPTFQYVDLSLFSSNLATSLITATTFINATDVRRLKALFGGSG